MEMTSNKQYWRLFWLLVGLWFLSNLLLLALQFLGTGLGFKVWPMGEDRVWLWIMQTSSGKSMPTLFWSINDRNPLSPYWYFLAKPIILKFPDFGWYLVRRPIDLMCALSVFVLIYRIGRGRFPFYAFSCGLLTMLWNFSAYREMCIWDRVGDLSVSAMCLWSYLKYVDGNRTEGRYFAISVLLYLVAVGTYTLQASVILPVFFFAMFRPSPWPQGRKAWVQRFAQAALDMGLFVAAFAIFYMIWTTVRRPAMDVYYKMTPALIAAQFKTAAWQAVWHSSYTEFLRDLYREWSKATLAVTGLTALGVIGGLLWQVRRLTVATKTTAPSEVTNVTETVEPTIWSTLAYTFLVLLGMCASTLVLESTSDIWYPGSRTLMIQQVFQPLMYCGLFFGATSLIVPFSRKLANRVQWAGMTVICTAAFLMGLEYNRQLNARTKNDQQFFAKLDQSAPQGFQGPKTIIMKLDPKVDLARWGLCTHRYVQTYYKNPKLNLQFLIPGPAIPEWAGYNTMVFLPDEVGVYMMGPDEGVVYVPYSQILFATHDGQKVTFQETISREDLAGYRVKFAREQPARCQSPVAQFAQSGAGSQE